MSATGDKSRAVGLAIPAYELAEGLVCLWTPCPQMGLGRGRKDRVGFSRDSRLETQR